MVTYNVGDGGNGAEETAWVAGEGPKPTATASTHRLKLDRLVQMLQILVGMFGDPCLPPGAGCQNRTQLLQERPDPKQGTEIAPKQTSLYEERMSCDEGRGRTASLMYVA